MIRALLPCLTVLATLGCQAKVAPPTREDDPEQREVAEAVRREGPKQSLSAAGVTLAVPANWTLVDDRDADFAIARAGAGGALCTIELRRQGGAGKAGGPEDYRRGTRRGRVQMLPVGDSSIVVHCMAPRAAQWRGIEDIFASMKQEPREPAALVANDGPIVELCTGNQQRRTYACVRRRDGAVFCGASEGETLERVAGIPASVQIGCDGARACSRDASGSVSCWYATGEPALLDRAKASRDLAGGCVVDGAGKVLCRLRDAEGKTTEDFAELRPLAGPDSPGQALAEVDQVLPGSNADAGCVLVGAELRCWDRKRALHLDLPDDQAVHLVAELAELGPITDLGWIGERVCVAAGPRWTCFEAEARFTLDDCQRDSCGCSVIGAMRLACEHEPFSRPEPQLYGRIHDVVVKDGPCAALRDGSVVCRGPLSGSPQDSAEISALLVGGPPGMLHAVSLHEETSLSNSP